MSAPESGALQVTLTQRSGIPLAVEFTCDPGKVLALVGPSGAGKSTILRAIAGLYRPQAGQVHCGGKTWLDTAAGCHVPVHERAVGMVFQDYALFPHLCARDNILQALGYLPAEQRPQRADELLASVNLDGLSARYPRQLSGGEQQRVAVARALAREPSVLLLDEPFSALDQVTRRKLRLELASIIRRLKMPVVLVTHDLDEASMLADSMCVLHRGTTLQHDHPAQVLARPSSWTVARLVDTRNLFTATLLSRMDDTLLLDWGGMRVRATNADRRHRAGQPLHWCLPATQVLLQRPDRPSAGDTENPVRCRVLELVTNAAGISYLLLAPRHLPDARLHMDLPQHAAERSDLAPGREVTVTLLAKAIHVMPE